MKNCERCKNQIFSIPCECQSCMGQFCASCALEHREGKFDCHVVAKETDYNGWKNRETWNIAIWIQNDQQIYNYARHFKTLGFLAMRRDLAVNFAGLKIGQMTPDNVSWNDPALDIEALDGLLRGL